MHSIVCEFLKQQRTNCCISIAAAVCRRRVCVYVSARDFACYWRGSIDKNIPISVCLCACGASVCLNKKRTCTSLCLSRVCVCVHERLTAPWCPWECPWAESAALCCCIAPRRLSTCRRQDSQTQEDSHYPQHLEGEGGRERERG